MKIRLTENSMPETGANDVHNFAGRPARGEYKPRPIRCTSSRRNPAATSPGALRPLTAHAAPPGPRQAAESYY